MKARLLLVHSMIGIFAINGAIAVEKEKSSGISDVPIWTVPKRGPVTEIVPGLNAVLNLSETQQQQIAAARDEVMGDDAVKAARGLSKNDPTITPEERDAARATIEAANTQLRSRVDGVLTPEQKALIENINGAYAAAIQEVGTTYQVKVASMKIAGEERMRMQQQQRDEVDLLFRRKLDEMLTAEQKEAMAGAASKSGTKKPALK